MGPLCGLIAHYNCYLQLSRIWHWNDAHATTVNKSQGSIYCLIPVIHKESHQKLFDAWGPLTFDYQLLLDDTMGNRGRLPGQIVPLDTYALRTAARLDSLE